jgi:Mn2+/Fe2+ NRAMP family transporter
MKKVEDLPLMCAKCNRRFAADAEICPYFKQFLISVNYEKFDYREKGIGIIGLLLCLLFPFAGFRIARYYKNIVLKERAFEQAVILTVAGYIGWFVAGIIILSTT